MRREWAEYNTRKGNKPAPVNGDSTSRHQPIWCNSNPGGSFDGAAACVGVVCGNYLKISFLTCPPVS